MLSLSFDSDNVPKATVSLMLPFFFFFSNINILGGSGEKENPVQVKTGKNPQSECPNLSLTHSQREKPNNHVWHNCHQGRLVFPDALGLLCPAGYVFGSQVAFAAILCLLVVSLICWCHFVPLSGCQWSRFIIPEQVATPSSPCTVCAPCPGERSGQLLHPGAAFPLHTVPVCSSGRKLSAACWVSSQSRENALLGSV